MGEWCQTVYPALQGKWIDLSTLVSQTVGNSRASLEERKALVEPPRGIASEAWLRLLEDFRLALVLSPDDVEFAFSELSDSKMAAEVRRGLEQYLHGPLSNDWPSSVLSLIEELENLDNPTPFAAASHWTLVPDLSPNLLFSQFAGALRARPEIDEVNIIDLWDLDFAAVSPAPPKRPLILSSVSSIDVVARLSERLRTLHNRHPSPITLQLEVSTEERWLIQLGLQKNGLKFTDLSEGPYRGEAIIFTPIFPQPDWAGRVVTWIGEVNSELDARAILGASALARLELIGISLEGASARAERLIARFRPVCGRSVFVSRPHWTSAFEGRMVTLERKTISERTAPKFENVALTRRPVFSATQIETFAACPAKYFFRYGMVLRPTLEGDDQFYLLLGELTHATLERAITNPRFLHAASDELKSQYLISLFKLLSSEKRLTNALAIALERSFSGFATKIPQLERQLTQLFGEFKTVGTEVPFQLEIDGFLFTGKIDRIIETASGVLVAIDYKTGNVDFSPNHIRSNDNFQALIYALYLENLGTKPAGGVLFYDLKQGLLSRGIVRTESLLPQSHSELTRGHALTNDAYNELLTIGREKLRQLCARILAGETSPTPGANACARCDFGAHCQVGVRYA